MHRDIAARLERFSQQVIAQQSPRLMLLVPPRHGKSELASIRFPAWHLGRAPSHELINVGYNLDLPMRFSRKVRELVRDGWYHNVFPETELDPDTQAAEAWLTTMGGGFTAAGVGGGITGKGAHILLIDDPIKNIADADSVNVREALWDWYLSTAYTRLAPGGGVLLIETWWNDDDLAGRLQQAARTDALADQFEIIRYPALAESYEYRHRETMEVQRTDEPTMHDDPEWELLREPGEAVHPERYSRDALERIKATLSPRLWSALYQQSPVPDEGAYFRKDYLRYYTQHPPIEGRRIITAWDFAILEKQSNDYTVGVTMLHDEFDNLFVLEMVRFKGDTFQIVEEVLDNYLRWGSYERADFQLGVEDGQIWRAIEPVFKRRMEERKLFPPYTPLRPFTDKTARARPLQGRMQQGKVWLKQDAANLRDMEMELLRFPGGAHDDIVDAMAWAAHLAGGHAPPHKPSYGRKDKVKSWKDKLSLIGRGQGAGHMAA